MDSPFDEKWLARMQVDEPISASIDITGFADVRSEALRAHATQVDPTSAMWFGLPPEVLRGIHPYDDYWLARSRVSEPGTPEDDLFAGIDVETLADPATVAGRR